jgi:predicted proteasome-type protease
MKKTIERIFKMNEVLVDVLVYLDSTKQSNTSIRSQVDTIVNFEKQLKEDSNREIELVQIKERNKI